MLKKIFSDDKTFYNRYQLDAIKKIQGSLIVILTCVLLIVLLFTESKLKLTYFLITIACMFAVLVSIYYTRNGRKSKAVFVLIASTVIVTWMPMIFDPSVRNGDFVPIIYLVIPVLLASIFTNAKLTTIIAIVQGVVAFLVIGAFKELQSQNWVSYIIFYFITVNISAISKYNYSKELERNETQRKEMEVVNKKLRKVSITDGLTNLYNRRHFFEIIEDEIKRAIRLNYKIILLSIDINNFKQVNDTHGHFKGDELLKNLATIISENIRDGLDTAFRFGGDEFTVILSNCSKQKAIKIANRIDKEFKEMTDIASLAYGVEELDIYNPDIEEVLKEADRKMYVHKKKVKEKG